MSGGAVRLGDTLQYRLSAEDAERLNRWRAAAAAAPPPPGVKMHRGPEVREGDICGAMVVRVWSQESVNLQVYPDGEGKLWVTERREGEGPGEWSFLPGS